MKNFRFAFKFLISLFVVCGFCSAVFATGKKDGDAAGAAENKAVSAEGGTEAGQSAVRAGVLNGPTGIPFAYLFENKPDFDGTALEMEVFANASIELPKLIKGEIQFGVLPPNLAAKVFNSTDSHGIVVLGICGNGNVYVISSDSGFDSLEDLKGKTVACAGQGATPDYVMRFILSKRGLSVGDGEDSVHLDYSTPNADIAAAVISGKFKYAVVPEPFATVATLKSNAVKRVVNLSDEYASFAGGGNYPISLLVANAEFVSKNRELTDKFIEEFKNSVEWTNKNPASAGALVQKHTLGLMAPVTEKAVPNANFVWIDAQSGRKNIEELLNIFLSFAPESVGGKLPGDEFYYGK